MTPFQKILASAPFVFMASLPAQANNYLGYTFKSLTFTDSEETSAIQYEDSAFQTVDFTLNLGDNMVVGAVIDLNQEQERNRNIMVKLGFGDWGAAIETGKIVGRFSSDSALTYQPTRGDFEYDYQGFKIYSYDSWNSKTGFTYATWTQPSAVVVSLDWDDPVCATSVCELSWVDPEVEYTFAGWFMTNLLMERLTEGARYEQGWNFETMAEFGFMTIDTSGANINRPNTQRDIKNESTSGLATKSTFQFGYYGGEDMGDDFGLSWGVGYELNLTGIVMGGRSTVDDDYVTTPSQHILGHGLYAKVMVRM